VLRLIINEALFVYMKIEEKYLPILFSVASALIYAIFFFFQPQTDYLFCPKCDAYQYQAIINIIKGLEYEQLYYPFHNRILIPAIVSIFPDHLTDLVFHSINFISVIIFTYFFSKILIELKIQIIVTIIALSWILFHFSGIIRPVILDYKTIDAPTICFHAILIYILLKGKYTYLLFLAPIGTLIKESFLAYTLVILAYSLALLLFNDKNKLPFSTILLAVLISFFVKLIVNKLILPIETHHNEVRTLFLHVYLSFKEPDRILRYIISFYVVYGVFLWISIGKIFTYRIKSHFEMQLFLLAFTSIGFGILGGGDTTRIMMLGFPFIILSIIMLLKEYSAKNWFILLIISIPALRIQSSIPDFSTNRIAYSEWFVEKMSGDSMLFWLTLSIIMTLLAYFFMNNKVKNKAF
jgi:hypothetical protein